MSDWNEHVSSVIECDGVSHGRSFYAPGEIAPSAIVITVTRVSDDDYRALADGKSDAIMRVEPNADD